MPRASPQAQYIVASHSHATMDAQTIVAIAPALRNACRPLPNDRSSVAIHARQRPSGCDSRCGASSERLASHLAPKTPATNTAV
jgi:hypothetical protein